ncbi:MAG: ketosteroid isomerase [Pedosphaera sp.]|nr:ketosteroid isomerase [Pedosphaera sp.]
MTAPNPNKAVSSDEQQIRDLVATWLRSSAAGDVATVLSLMAEDVVFLVPGQPPMRGREAFAAASRAMEGKFRMEGNSEIQEIQISGDLAYCWTRLSVTVHPLPSGAAKRRSGHTLSVLRKQPAGNWVLIRDANMLVAEN